MSLVRIVEGRMTGLSFDIFDRDQRIEKELETSRRMKEHAEEFQRAAERERLDPSSAPPAAGTPLYSISRQAPFQSEPEPEPQLKFSTKSDLERLEIEKRLTDKAMMTAEYNHFPVSGSALIDRKARAAIVSEGLQELFYPSEEIDLDQTFISLDDICERLHPDDLRWMSEVVKLQRRPGEILTVEYRVREHDLSNRFYLIRDTSVAIQCDNQGQAELVLSLMLDVSGYLTAGGARLSNPNLPALDLSSVSVEA